jgi:hypothetical protein
VHASAWADPREAKGKIIWVYLGLRETARCRRRNRIGTRRRYLGKRVLTLVDVSVILVKPWVACHRTKASRKKHCFLGSMTRTKPGAWKCRQRGMVMELGSARATAAAAVRKRISGLMHPRRPVDDSYTTMTSRTLMSELSRLLLGRGMHYDKQSNEQ